MCPPYIVDPDHSIIVVAEDLGPRWSGTVQHRQREKKELLRDRIEGLCWIPTTQRMKLGSGWPANHYYSTIAALLQIPHAIAMPLPKHPCATTVRRTNITAFSHPTVLTPRQYHYRLAAPRHHHLCITSFQDRLRFALSTPTTTYHSTQHTFATMASATSFFDFKVKDSKFSTQTHGLSLACCLHVPIHRARAQRHIMS